MKSKNIWSDAKLTPIKNLPRFPWLAGYFRESHYGWDQNNCRQNSHELLLRDYMIAQIDNLEGSRVLDVGCGAGTYAMVLAELGAELSGQDLNGSHIEQGRKNFADLSLACDFKVGDAQSLQFSDEYFDYVVSADFFEHITPEVKTRVLSEIYRVLKPGGLAIIKTPNLRYLQAVINAKRLANLIRFKSPKIYIAHTHNNPDNEHHGLTTYEEMKQLILQSHFMEPEVVDLPWRRSMFYVGRDAKIPLRRLFNEHILIKFRKSYFVPLAERLNRRVLKS